MWGKEPYPAWALGIDELTVLTGASILPLPRRLVTWGTSEPRAPTPGCFVIESHVIAGSVRHAFEVEDASHQQ